MPDLLRSIREILNRQDVEGFLALGAPEDEYQSEAKLILRAIESGEVRPRKEELCELLANIWERMFGPFAEEEIKKREAAFRRIASQLALTYSAPSPG